MRLQNDIANQTLSVEDCVELCRQVQCSLDDLAIGRSKKEGSKLKVAGAHLQMVIDLLDEPQPSEA